MTSIAKLFIQYVLFLLAKIYLLRHKPYIIAVSGSTNRQSLKEEIAKKLHDHFNIRVSPKNFNAELGIPLSILDISTGMHEIRSWIYSLSQGVLHCLRRAKEEVLIVELAVSQPKDMRYLVRLLRPHIVVLSDVTSEYLTSFGTLEKKAKEYQELIAYTRKGGLVVLNADDARISALTASANVGRETYGIEQVARYSARDMRETDQGVRFELSTPLSKHASSVAVRVFGKHAVYASLAAEAVYDYATKYWKT